MLVNELKAWLKKKGNTKTEIAWLLKYKSTSVIDKWLRTGLIPQREVMRVTEIIRRETNNVNVSQCNKG